VRFLYLRYTTAERFLRVLTPFSKYTDSHCCTICMGRDPLRWNGARSFFQETCSRVFTTFPSQAFLPESPRYLLLKNRQVDAREALGRLMSLPHDSPEVQAEAVEISTALTVEEQNSGKSTYLDCFKNNENRNGFRTWTGILMHGVRFINTRTF